MTRDGASGEAPKARLPWGWLLVLAVLLLPLFQFGAKDTHDWGDDFAQYLSQARDISNFQLANPDDEVPNHALYGPVPKGVGFSVVIAPFWGAFGDNVQPYLLLNSTLLFLSAMLCFIFLCRSAGPLSFGPLPALLAALLFAYDRHVLQAASEIMPDLLLGCLVLVALLLMQRYDAPSRWGTVVTVGFATVVKSAGWVLYATMLLHFLFLRHHRHGPRPKLLETIGLMLLPLIIHLALVAPWLLGNAAGDAWYAHVFTGGSLPGTIMANVPAYAWTCWQFFEQELPMWMNRILVPFVLVAVITGMVRRYRSRPDAGDVLFALWMVMLLCYPYTAANDRFLVPMLPIVFRFLLNGMAWFAARVQLPAGKTVAALLALFLLAHAKGLQLYASTYDRPVPGPYSAEAKEAFAEIKQLDPEGVAIGAGRPWAVHLYTGLPVALWPVAENNGVPGKMPGLVLLCTDPKHAGMYDEQVLRTVRHEERLKPVWQNSSFVILRDNDPNP